MGIGGIQDTGTPKAEGTGIGTAPTGPPPPLYGLSIVSRVTPPLHDVTGGVTRGHSLQDSLSHPTGMG